MLLKKYSLSFPKGRLKRSFDPFLFKDPFAAFKVIEFVPQIELLHFSA